LVQQFAIQHTLIINVHYYRYIQLLYIVYTVCKYWC
jgi:hypothetical protein